MPTSEDKASPRTRTVTWQDPRIGAEAGQSMSGVEYLQAVAAGKLPPPPIAVLMGLEFLEVEVGRVVFGVKPAEYHYNPNGTVHGGLASTLFDSALGCAVHSTLPAGTGYTTIELHVNFIRPMTKDTGPVRCEAEVIHVGRRMATAQARLVDETGKLYGHATTTCMLFSPSPNDRGG